MRFTARGVGHAALFIICVVVLVVFLVGVAYGLGYAMVDAVSGLSE